MTLPDTTDGPTARCRACGSDPIVEVLDLGRTPIADLLLTEEQVGRPESTFPLVVGFCRDCALLQIVHLIPQEELYGDTYPYYTSEVPGLVEHFGASARRIMEERPLGPDSLVVEAASNDGYMLRLFAERGIPVLGIDPASGPAEVAEAAGVPTIVDFFGVGSVRPVVDGGRRADVVLGNNVLNLVPDPGDFADAVDLLLAPGGIVVLEVPYVVDTVEQVAYDNFFHQNSSYFSLTAVQRLFEPRGITVTDAERVDTFGGSLRVTLEREGRPGPRAAEFLAAEDAMGVADASYYSTFAAAVARSRDELVALLDRLHGEGSRIIAYGAAGGMATTLVSYAGIDGSVIDYAVDANPHKHGGYTPGSQLLIRPVDAILEDQPDYVLLLAWNYADAVLAAQAEFRERGGRFIIPVPSPHIV